jgi:hypothetical protein
VKKPSNKRTSTTIKMIQSKLTRRHLLSRTQRLPRKALPPNQLASTDTLRPPTKEEEEEE